jgi:2-oxoglutarate ferredoxin oxidoreductase subunit alpha
MTPATPLMFELAPKQLEKNFMVLELESEIAVAMAALGTSMTGAKTMIGTSGGGFDLMTEALSCSAMAEIPIVAYLCSRPGPGTGVATYTGQGDLKLALNYGHGEFFHFAVAPGNPEESAELTSQCFYFSQKYKIPTILLGDKHLAEALYTIEKEGKITPSTKSTELKRYNSYEHTNNQVAVATEDAEEIKQGPLRRAKIVKEIEKEAEKFEMYKTFGKKDSKNIILSYGSPKGAILDAIHGLDVKFIQILYLSPFPTKIKDELKNAKTILLVENSSTGELAGVIAKKLQIKIPIENKILRWDGRPFFSDELQEEIKRRIK